MIIQISSDLPNFHTAHFDDGMNVVLADQAEDAAETDSTNGLGKTTLIRIAHFCFGSDLARDKVLSHPDLRNVSFRMLFFWGDHEIDVTRSTANGGATVTASSVFFDGLDLEPIEKTELAWTVSVEDWNNALTHRFLLRKRTSSQSVDLGSPTFRELSYYYMRVGKSAFVDPRQVYQGQSGRSKQVSIW